MAFQWEGTEIPKSLIMRFAVINEQDKLRREFLLPENRCDTEITAETKKIWKVELDLLETFIRICDKYNLRWFMIGGSLIGTVRHKGFVPWDDDIDVTMPRPDFNKFLKVAAAELAYPLELSASRSEPERWYTLVTRICNSNTTAILRHHVAEQHLHYNCGIFLDISPLDGVSKSKWLIKVQNFLIAHLRMLGYLRFARGSCKRVRFGRLKRAVSIVCYSVLGNRFLFWLKNRICSFIPYGATDTCGVLAITFLERDQWPYSAFRQTIRMPFEYLTVNVPAGYDDILSKRYGNWRHFARQETYHELEIHVDIPYKNVLVEKYGYDANEFKNGG